MSVRREEWGAAGGIARSADRLPGAGVALAPLVGLVEIMQRRK